MIRYGKVGWSSRRGLAGKIRNDTLLGQPVGRSRCHDTFYLQSKRSVSNHDSSVSCRFASKWLTSGQSRQVGPGPGLAVGTFVPQLLLGLTRGLAACLGLSLIVLSGASVLFWLKIFLVCCLLRSCLWTRSVMRICAVPPARLSCAQATSPQGSPLGARVGAAQVSLVESAGDAGASSSSGRTSGRWQLHHRTVISRHHA